VREKFIVFHGEVITLTEKFPDRFFDERGTEFAIESDASADPITRCGVGYLSLPVSHPLTSMCKIHDYMYNSRTFQVYHSRDEADRKLRDLIRKSPSWWWLAQPFYYLAHWFGTNYWEQDSTR